MAKYKSVLIFIILACILSNICVFATNEDSPHNIEIVQLKLLEDNSGVLSVYYGYPISPNFKKIEHVDLVNDGFNLAITELSVNNDRYAIVYCSVPYKNTDELLAKIQAISLCKSEEYKSTLFNFYVLLDSIANNLNFTAIQENTVSLTIDTSSFVNQKYYMTRLDTAIVEKLDGVDISTMRHIDTSFYLITSRNIGVSNAEQFLQRELTDVYTEYSCSLNNQKLSITLQKIQEVEIPEEPDTTIEGKLNKFLESKYYTLFIAGCCIFIVVAVILMIIIAKSYNKVIEKEEKLNLQEREAHDANAPKLYWSQDERELENKKKKLLNNPNALVRDGDLENTESIEKTQYKRQSNFK